MAVREEDYFITTWQTTVENESITIPTTPDSALVYSYDVDWGDGTIETGFTGNATHTYAVVGEYDVKITGMFPRIHFNNTGDKEKILRIKQWGNMEWKSMDSAFEGCINLNLDAEDIPNLSQVNSLIIMFGSCISLKGNESMNNWDVSMAVDMSRMFLGCTAFNQAIGNWDVGNVTDMGQMFDNCRNFNQDISSWNVGKVANMGQMFDNCRNFNQDISSWNVSNTTNMSQMFYYSTAFNQYIGSWNVSSVTDMSSMFSSSLTFNQDIGNWDVSNVTNMSQMFFNSTVFNQDIGSWDVSKVINMSLMFGSCNNFNQDIGAWDVSQVTNMSFLFSGCESFNQDIGDWNVSGVTNMQSMFDRCTNFNQDIGRWDVTNVTNMSQLFYKCTSFNKSISAWSVSNVTNMRIMFNDCINFNQDIGSWDVGNAKNMYGMFSGCSNFNQDIGAWDVSKVTSMGYMFSYATSFNQDIGSWDVSQVKGMRWMLNGCSSFNQNIGTWNIGNVTDMDNMLVSSNLSTQNYDAVLIGWSELQLKNNIDLGADNLNYCNGDIAKAKIIEDFGWAITDAGKDADCVPTSDDSEAFITTWQTTEANESITIPTTPSSVLVYSYDIDWGDGTIETGFTGNAIHTYAVAGEYNVKITGVFPSIVFAHVSPIDRTKILSIIQWGNIEWKTMRFAFSGCSNLKIEAQDTPNLFSVTDMQGMFQTCSSFEGNESINRWDVSNITDMRYLFRGCFNFNQNISAWDVSNVVIMSEVFSNCINFNQDVSTWNVSKVTDMSQMFHICNNFNQDIGSWDVSNVVDMSFMFSNCYDFNQDIGSWNVSQVTHMGGMFSGCTNFNQDISTWDVSQVTNMASMFLRTPFNYDIGSWDVSQVTNMASLFQSNIIFNQDISTWDVSQVANMAQVFYSATNFNQDIGGWNVSQVTSMSRMFYGATNFNQDISNWDVSQVTNMYQMFFSSRNFDQNIRGWNVSQVTNMQFMFANASLSTQNYDAILIGWSQLILKEDVEFHAGNSNYCKGETARTKIIEDFGWTITDSGKDVDCVSLADVNLSIITADPNTIIANGIETSTITVTLNDEKGTIIASPTNTVIITTSLGEVTNTVNNNDGTYAAELSSNEAGTAILVFTLDGQVSPNTAEVILEPFVIEITENTKIQSPNFYLQASGSNGTDGSATGIHTRWGFKGELGTKHLPKGDLAQSNYNYNKPNDYVWLYRAPYQKVERIIDFATIPKVVDNTNALWIYEVDEKRFTISFKDKTSYANVQNTINPLQNPLNFIESYGNGLIEIESKRDLFFAVTIEAQNIATNSVLQVETLSAAENTLISLKKVSNRKTVNGTAINDCRFLCDNGRTLRFKASNHFISSVKVELYEDLIHTNNNANSWTSLGKFSLTLEDEIALKQLEPEASLIHGKWPKFNDGATVNINNYINKWNVSGSSEEDRNLKDVIAKYVELSDAFDNPSAIEQLVFNDVDVVNSEEDIMEISNLDMLNLAATDYHIARMLGLGTLDIDEEVLSGDYVYLAVYKTLERQPHPTEEIFYAGIQHLAVSLPTSIQNERLPLPLSLNEIVPGAKFNNESPDTIDLTDENGYTHDGKKRYVTLYLEGTYEENYNPSFFENTFEFELNTISYPLFAGVEYRDIRTGEIDDYNWNKPEISHDLRYYSIDTTVNEQGKKYEPFPLALPENNAPLLVHKQTTSGTHYYGTYSINLFSRVSSTNLEVAIVTDLIPTNALLPPSNIQVQLIQEEEPVLLTSIEEQERRKNIEGEDKTLVRATFDYHSVHEMAEYQISDSTIYSDDELLNDATIIFPDSEEVYADEVEVFFRNELPQNISGKIVAIEDDPNDILIVSITVSDYNLVSVGETLIPSITNGKEQNYIGGSFVIGSEQYIIHNIINTSTYPVFKVYKKEISDSLVESEIPTIDAENLQSPQIVGDGLFIAIENMQNIASWEAPNPFSTKINLGNYPVKREIVEKQVDEDNLQRFLQKSRGVWSNNDAGNTTITEELEVINPEGEMGFRGIYRIVFHDVQLNQNDQFTINDNSVEWHRGIVRIPLESNSKGERKTLKVVKIFNIVHEGTQTTNVKDLELLVYDESYETIDKQIQIGNNVSVNFYPGYKCYFYADNTYNFNEENTLPDSNDDLDVKSSILGFRSSDVNHISGESYFSKISTPSILIGQRLIEPKVPEEPQGALYATRPDYFGRSSYKITNTYKHKPHGVLFYRTNDEALLNAIYEKETVLKIKEDLKNIFGNSDEYFANRWKNFINFKEILELGDYKTFPEDETPENTYKFPNPDKKALFQRANDMITILNENLDESEEVNALFNIDQDDDEYEIGNITVGNERLIGFVRDAILNSFVPLTEIPIVYNYINSDKDYIPVNKKQVIRDGDGLVLKPGDEEFDMAPMMKITGESDYETEFVDFTLDGTSNNIYFYGVREMSSRMQLGEFAPFLGPIKLVNTNPPEAPEIKRIVPVLENTINNTLPSIQIEINPYPVIQNIKRINIYRAFNKLDAQTVRTMTLVKTVDVSNITISLGDFWVVKDEFEDLTEVPYGKGLFYIITVDREVESLDKTAEVVLNYVPSQSSKIVATIMVESNNPSSPTLEYTADPIDDLGVLNNINLNWQKTCYNGKYYVYKMNSQGNWEKIHELQSNENLIQLDLVQTSLNTSTINTLDPEGNLVYSHFKVIAENTSGMLSNDEYIVTIPNQNNLNGIGEMIVGTSFIIR